MTTEERLEKLERELARGRRVNQWFLAAIGVIVIAWVLSGVLRSRAAEPQVDKTTVKEVLAKGFAVEDENGNVRAALGMGEDGPALRLFDEKGNPCVALFVLKDAPGLVLYDDSGRDRAVLGVLKDGPWFSLFDENGKERATLGTAKTGTPGGKAITYPESSLILFGRDGKAVWRAP